MTTPDLQMTLYVGSLPANLDGGRSATGYEIHSDTRSQRAVAWRKLSVENNWVEGTYDVAAVRGNITELVAIWVYGTSTSDFWQRVYALTDQLAQATFATVWTINGMTETWDCTYSDHTIETQREFQYATMGIVRISMARRPKVNVTFADSTTYAS
jgi:hypothetical protein